MTGLEELDAITKRADELYEMLTQYETKAKEFDQMWARWEKNHMNLNGRTRVHPCHIAKMAIEASRESKNHLGSAEIQQPN